MCVATPTMIPEETPLATVALSAAVALLFSVSGLLMLCAFYRDLDALSRTLGCGPCRMGLSYALFTAYCAVYAAMFALPSLRGALSSARLIISVVWILYTAYRMYILLDTADRADEML